MGMWTAQLQNENPGHWDRGFAGCLVAGIGFEPMTFRL
jgi:hypothetical protein